MIRRVVNCVIAFRVELALFALLAIMLWLVP
jgi:hypothetical protein